jgi:DHA2 family multidrug resistance protein
VFVQWNHPRPLVNLRLFGRRNFGFAGLTNVALGLGLYGLSYVLPVYLAQVQHYNSTQIGQTIMWMGWPQLVLMPLVARVLMPRFDPRTLVTIGMALFGSSALFNGWMSHDTGYEQLIASQLLRALGQPLIMVPLTAIATSGIEPAQAGNASALFNMMRNLGGSVGIALGGMLVSLRERFHGARLGEAVSEYAPATQLRMTELTVGFMQSGSEITRATQQALMSLQLGIRREAYVMAFGDCFLLLGVVLLLSITTIWCCRNSESRPPGPVH